jgi:hypothetical protein
MGAPQGNAILTRGGERVGHRCQSGYVTGIFLSRVVAANLSVFDWFPGRVLPIFHRFSALDLMRLRMMLACDLLRVVEVRDPGASITIASGKTEGISNYIE